MFRRTEKRCLVCGKKPSHDRAKAAFTGIKQFPNQRFSCVKAGSEIYLTRFPWKRKKSCFTKEKKIIILRRKVKLKS